MHGHAVTLATNHLFEINSMNPIYLTTDKTEVYIRLIMQLFFLSQHTHLDIHTVVSFLNSQLLQPNEDDYKKLIRVMKYLDGMVDMPLVLSANNSGQIHWWIDASFAVHTDMKSHTGVTMSMGKGAIYSTSRKQKHVTHSSTEAEIVAVHDVMPQLIWTGYFLAAQGFNIKSTTMYQDNMSSILIEKNGRQSSSKHTWHMNI